VSSEIISLLPSLEPICGGALALNLAYLNLDRFRYAQRLKEAARDSLARVDNSVPKANKNLPWWKHLISISELNTRAFSIQLYP